MDVSTKHLEAVCHFLPMKSRRLTPRFLPVWPEYLVDYQMMKCVMTLPSRDFNSDCV